MKQTYLFPILLAGSVSIAASLITWSIAASHYTDEIAHNRGNIIRAGTYNFINPILGCEVAPKDSFPEMKPVEKVLGALIAAHMNSNDDAQASVYLRLLNSGRWFGINEENEYIPASLMKVMIMMTYFKGAEADPSLLQKKITYRSKNPSLVSLSNPLANLQDGTAYTVQDLVRIMIVQSSNAAMSTLIDNLNGTGTRKLLQDAYSELSISLPASLQEKDMENMSPKNYSFIFRALYGATFLGRDMSENALKLLSQTAFNEGLVSGVEPGIRVSHKFGAQSLSADGPNSEHQLHDCGIIYLPDHPYLLCVMTKGRDFNTLAAVISDISKTAYEQLKQFFKN